LGLEDCPEFVGLGAFAGYESDIFEHVGEKCAKVSLAVYNAGTRANPSKTEGRAPCQIAEHLMGHR
jgi:hypothetical protein